MKKEKSDIKETAESSAPLPIGPEQLLELTGILQKYKAGKNRTESRIVSSENWWKLRNTGEETKNADFAAAPGFKSVSGWLHNVIVSKHADAVEAYPEPLILPREQSDRSEASVLSRIVPCIMEQNEFERCYSDAMWQKLKTGTGVYKIVWDASKLNGLGDVAIERVNLLNIYWEPGITDIQKSRFFFHTELADREALETAYPELEGKLGGNSFVSAKFLYDDSVDCTDKVTVIECYYRKRINGVMSVQYVKYVGDAVLYATENQPELAQKGLYDHGKYPYVFDPLFPIEGSPCGYGYVDLCRNPQTEIDLLKTAFVKNAAVGATPRYFSRQDGGVNEAEFLDLKKPLVHVNGNLGEDSLRQIDFSPLDSIYVSVLDRTIEELRQTSGNTESSTGNAGSGVTAASAIAALQEASGKGSRDSNLASYRAYSEIVGFVIELIRQFYDLPRQFRIVGQYGAEQFISYSNAGIQPQQQGADFGEDMGYRLPVFDIRVAAQKRSVYTRVSQNELALQFFRLGFFNPQLMDQSLLCLQMMDFEGKEELTQKLAQLGGLRQKLIDYMRLSLTLAQASRPELVTGLAADIERTLGGGSGAKAPLGGGNTVLSPAEPSAMSASRARSRESAGADGGRVSKGGAGLSKGGGKVSNVGAAKPQTENDGNSI